MDKINNNNTPHIIRKLVGGQFFIGDLDSKDAVNTEVEICLMEQCARLHSKLKSRVPRNKKHQYVPVTFKLVAEIKHETPAPVKKRTKKGHKK
jgi:hypothetical protein